VCVPVDEEHKTYERREDDASSRSFCVWHGRHAFYPSGHGTCQLDLHLGSGEENGKGSIRELQKLVKRVR